MDNSFWKLKITAFLHNPPQKALLSGRGMGHERIARDLISAVLGTEVPGHAWEAAIIADRLASGFDRIDFPGEIEARWGEHPILRHPLSGEVYDLAHLKQADIEQINQKVQATAARIGSRAGGGTRKTFLYLWRHLADDLKSIPYSGQAPGCLWDLLPADTRTPEHTIWQYNKSVSALAGALPNPSLLAMSIEPVKDFIISSRKTRDLWAGSWILSFLAWEGMKRIVERWGPDAILFPELREHPLVDRWLADELAVPGMVKPNVPDLEAPSLPNRWVAVMPADYVEETAIAAEEAIRNTWERLCDGARQMVEAKIGTASIDRGQWTRQQQWLEVCWAASSWPVIRGAAKGKGKALLDAVLGPDPEFSRQMEVFRDSGKWRLNSGAYYGRMHSLAYRIHASRKTLHDFAGSKEGEQKEHKCTLCGERDPMEAGTIGEEPMAFWKQLAAGMDPGTVEPGGRERLCTVCLTKRLAPAVIAPTFNTGLRFPSTSEIAATVFKIAVFNQASHKEEDGLRQAIKSFVESLPSTLPAGSHVPAVGRALERTSQAFPGEAAIWQRFAETDGEWLYPESYDSEEAQVRLSEVQPAMSRCIGNLYLEAEKAGISNPTPYYAALLFNGDHMGQWVSGTHPNLPGIQDLLHPDAQQQCRETFGEEVMKQKRPQSLSLQGELSWILSGQALHIARHVVESDHRGKLVYCGGDDIFALVPLEDALSVADALQKAFQKPARITDGLVSFTLDLQKPLNPGGSSIRLSMGRNATTSAGIALAHYRQPLFQVREAAQRMEKRAKDVLNRAAFSSALLKRSGERLETGAKWNAGEGSSTISYLQEVISLVKADKGLSPRFLTYLKAEHTDLSLLPPSASEHRVTYLLQRHMRSMGEAQGRETAARLAALTCALTEYHGHETSIGDSWKETTNLLTLACFIARHSGKEVAP